MGAAAFVGRIAASISLFIVAAALATLKNLFDIIAGVGALYVLMARIVVLAGRRTSGKALELLERGNELNHVRKVAGLSNR